MNQIRATLLACSALFLFVEIAWGVVLKKTDPHLLSNANRISMPFVENKGQLDDPNILFYSNTFAGRVSVTRDGAIGYRLSRNTPGKEKQLCEIREKLGGAVTISPSGGQKAIAKVSHFQGVDPGKWVTDIPTFDGVQMGEIYQGISLRLQSRGNNVEKIFSVHPGADPKKIQLKIDGAKSLKLTEQGELEVDTGTGSMRFTKPEAYQWISGKKTLVYVAYAVKGTSYGFQLGAYDHTKELIIDPLITAIFQGAAETKTMPTCMAADSQGNIYAAGFSAKQFAVFKFDSKCKTLLGSALFGSMRGNLEGFGPGSVYDIAVDRHNDVYLVGSTRDEAFPVTQGAFDTSFGGGWYELYVSDGFVMKYNSDLNTLLASTFIGEDWFDAAYGIAIAGDDTVFVVGETIGHGGDAVPFPTTPGAYDTTSGFYMNTKAFVARLDNELQTLLASTQLGYNGVEDSDNFSNTCAYDVAIDASGSIIVAGNTTSEHFPITDNCADASFQGTWEAFVSKFDPDLTQLLASTFLGGENKERAKVLGVAPHNEVVVAGWTNSSDFPVVQGTYDTSFSGEDEDGFVTRLNSELTTIMASTFIGGDGREQVRDLFIGRDGTVYLSGNTTSTDFPVTENAHDKRYNGPAYITDFYDGDGFLTIFDQALTTLSASTYLGGRGADHISAILVKGDDIIAAGATSSTNFPYMTVGTGYTDAFICRFNANETPEPRPFTGRSGHWQSRQTGLADRFYLDINICDDGSFSGKWQPYLCGPPSAGLGCILWDEGPSIQVSGTVDFSKWVGTITKGDDCKDIAFHFLQQIPDHLALRIDSDGAQGDCSQGFISSIAYKGEPEEGACQVIPGGSNGSDTSGGSSDGSGSTGGGGGSCFLNSLWCYGKSEGPFKK